MGLSIEETTELTKLMAYSGVLLDPIFSKGIKIGKHSTGGVGDKVLPSICWLLVFLICSCDLF